MTGKKIIAAKLMALSTVLAAGGGGVYCYTSGVKPWTWLAERAGTGKAELKPQSGTDSKLDAVASAWAESKPTRYSETPAAPPTARSAGTTTTQPEIGAATTASSRYDRYGITQLPPANAVDSANLTTVSAQTAVSDESKSLADASAGARDLSGRDPSLSEVKAQVVEQPSVVRGQNPVDAARQAVDANTIRDDAAGAGAGALRLSDEPAANGAPLSAAAARARQAFNDPSPSAGDRYRTAGESARKAEAPAMDDGTRLNPFALQTGQSVAAMATQPANIAAQTQPDPRGGLANSAPIGASGYDRVPEPGRFSPSGYGSAAGGYNAGQQQPLMASGGRTSMNGGGLMPSMSDPQNGPEGTGKPGERALEGAQNPALMIQKLAPPEIQVGKTAKFLIKVRNTGGQAATDVVIHDEVPQGTRLVSTSPIAETAAGGQLMWRFGTLSVGEERTIEMQLMPTAEGEIGSVATVSYLAQASIKTRSTMPQLAIKMTAPKQVMVGQEERVKILLNNPGSGDATGVMLFENVPENVKHAAGPALEFEIGTLRAGETRELELVLLAQKAGKVTNVLSARAEGNLQVQQQVDFEVIAPGLTVAVVGPERRYLERPATYEIRVENPGTATARDIQLVTKLPKGMKFVRANNMGEYDAATNAVYWSLAELPEKEHGSVELVAMPIETGPQTLEVEGHAQQGLSDQTKQQILIEGLAAIMFEVRDLEDPIEVGKETTYEIRIVNQGTKAATNVQVAVALPQGMQFVSAEGETKSTAQSGGVIFAPLKQLAPKADTVYRLKVQCRAAGDQRVTVEVKTDDQAQPIRREESTRVFGDE